MDHDFLQSVNITDGQNLNFSLKIAQDNDMNLVRYP